MIKVKSLKKNPYDIDISKNKGMEAILEYTKNFENINKKNGKVQIFCIQNNIILIDFDANTIFLLNSKLEQITSVPLSFEVKAAYQLDDSSIAITDTKGNLFNYSVNSEWPKLAIPDLKKTASSTNKLNDILEAPMKHLKEITTVLEESITTEQLYDSHYSHLHNSQSSIAFPLNNLLSYSRVAIQLQFSHLPKQVLSEVEENTIRKIISEPKAYSKEAQIEENNFPLFEKASLDPAVLKYLPITVHSIKGGAFNQFLPAACMTTPSVEIFASKYSNAEFIFKHLHEKTLLVDSVTISAPLKPSGLNAFPI